MKHKHNLKKSETHYRDQILAFDPAKELKSAVICENLRDFFLILLFLFVLIKLLEHSIMMENSMNQLLVLKIYCKFLVIHLFF